MMLVSVVKGEQLAIMCKAVSPSSGVTVATDAPWSIRKLAEYWSPAIIQYSVLLSLDASLSLCHLKYDTQPLFDNYHLVGCDTMQCGLFLNNQVFWDVKLCCWESGLEKLSPMTRCRIPLDYTFQQHCSKNLKPYMVICIRLRNSSLLGCNAVSWSKRFLTFQRIRALLYSSVK
jgi:hypothetical protein